MDRREGIDGIWSVDADSLEIKQDLTLTRRIYGWSQLDTGHIILHARRMEDRHFFRDSYAEYGVVRFDPVTKNADVTHQLGGNRRGMGENLPRTEDTNEFVFTGTTNITLARDYLWTGLLIITGRREILAVPLFEKTHAGMTRGIMVRSGAAYIPVPGTRAVVAVGPDCRHIYYLDLNSEEIAKTGSARTL